jgi:hypothetical protein
MAMIEIELPDELFNQIQKFLQNSNLTLEQFIIQAVEHELENQQKKEEINTQIWDFKTEIDTWNDAGHPNTVFNTDLENINWNYIKYIIVGDNPGEKEKEAGKYLVSEDNEPTSSGCIAEKIFDYLEIKKNQQYVVLNKCPIYTKETSDLKGGLLKESQEYMAQLTFNLHKLIGNGCKVYIFGFGGAYDLEKGWLPKKSNGDYYANQTMPFYFEKLKDLYSSDSALQESLFIMKHFSYWNIFSDLFYTDDDAVDDGGKIINGKRVSLSLLKDKKIDKAELLEALENLGYKEALFRSNSHVR